MQIGVEVKLGSASLNGVLVYICPSQSLQPFVAPIPRMPSEIKVMYWRAGISHGSNGVLRFSWGNWDLNSNSLGTGTKKRWGICGVKVSRERVDPTGAREHTGGKCCLNKEHTCLSAKARPRTEAGVASVSMMDILVIGQSFE